MSRSWRTKIWQLFNIALKRNVVSKEETFEQETVLKTELKGEKEDEFEPIVLAEGKHPWHNNLKRLASERPNLEQSSQEITNFVNNLSTAAGAINPEEALVRPKRLSDGTVTDIKSWWNHSISAQGGENGSLFVGAEQKRNGRTINRWKH